MSYCPEFDAASHTYRIPGTKTELVSVSTLLTPIIDFGDAPINMIKNAAARGTMVHRACELWDYGELDEKTLDARLVPYLAGWKKFMLEWGPEWVNVEEPEYHPELLYAGTPDRRGIWRGKRILVDLKATWKLNDAVEVQLSGYDLLDVAGKSEELWSVRVTRDGTYERHVHPPLHSTFLSLLNVFRWREKKGLHYPKW